jgi:hypothetical protein
VKTKGSCLGAKSLCLFAQLIEHKTMIYEELRSPRALAAVKAFLLNLIDPLEKLSEWSRFCVNLCEIIIILDYEPKLTPYHCIQNSFKVLRSIHLFIFLVVRHYLRQ